MYPWGWWKDLSWNWYNYFYFLNLTQRLKYSSKKEGAAEESNVDFEMGVKMHLLQNSVAGWGKSGTEPMCVFCCLVTWKEQFFICYLAAPQQTLGYCQVDSHFYPMLITVFWHSWLVGRQELCHELGKNNLISIDLSTAK